MEEGHQDYEHIFVNKLTFPIRHAVCEFEVQCPLCMSARDRWRRKRKDVMRKGGQPQPQAGLFAEELCWRSLHKGLFGPHLVVSRGCLLPPKGLKKDEFRKGVGGQLCQTEIEASFLHPFSFAPLGARRHISGQPFWLFLGACNACCSPTPSCQPLFETSDKERQISRCPRAIEVFMRE